MADWDPALYNRFQEYRAEPVTWIFERLPLAPADTVADFGCGTGEHTVEFARRVERGQALGIDSSPAMIAQADQFRASLEADLQARVHFVKGDFRVVTDEEAYSVIFSNAALQWAADHREVLQRWFRALRSGGRMVVQMPANHEETAQVTLGELAREAGWRGLLGGLQTPSSGVDRPDNYRAMLAELGFVEIDCYYRQFEHPMASPAAIVDFTRATTLRPFLDRLPRDRHAEFVGEFTRRLERAYGTNGPLILPFRRLFLWAQRPA
jgi:trans-aconitate 2-methyltransferase